VSHQIAIAGTGIVVADALRVADTHWSRMRGLLGTGSLEPGAGLWIVPCQQVHMFGMRYPIDVVFLDAAGRVLATTPALRPWRVSPRVAAARSVLELPAGTVERLGVRPGMDVAITGPTAARAGVRWERVGSILVNVLLAVLWILFATRNVANAERTGRWLVTMPLVAEELVLVGLFLTRRQTVALSSRPQDWLVGAVGTFGTLFLRPSDQSPVTAAISAPVQAIAFFLMLLGAASLGRSFGIVAANRGVQVRGLYRIVRHPIYAAHMLGDVGYLLAHPTAFNVACVLAVVLAQVVRARAEERLLSTDPGYVAYAEQVRWRFVPYLY
jgi:protein-S-isoprenylcysteine O-methyltransferase Ste14/uncharacterized membrane protein (UPF0127 family)